MMPKVKPTQRRMTKQVTISKFFASKHLANEHQNGLQIVTDDDRDVSNTKKQTPSGKSQKRRKDTGTSSPSVSKKQCIQQVFANTSITNTGMTSSSMKPCTSTEDIRERTTRRLQAFEFDGENEHCSERERELWTPKNLPDVFSQVDEQQECGVIAVSDGSDNDSTQPSLPEAKHFSRTTEPGNKDKKGTGQHKAGIKVHPSALSDKFSAFSCSSTAGRKSQTKYTPLEQQFIEIKEQYADAILLVECGYKYRFFGQDAEIAAKVLKIYCHPDHNFQTASIPSHRLFVHIRRLVAAGYKVGVVKQTETAALKAAGDNRSGPFTRKLSALYTKSTLIGEDVDPLCGSLESDGEQNTSAIMRPQSYLMCVYDFLSDSKTKQQQIGILAVDPATGDKVYDCFMDDDRRHELETRLTHLQPVEVLMSASATSSTYSLLDGLAILSSTQDDRIRIEQLPEEKFIYSEAFETVSNFFDRDKEKLPEMLALPKPVLCCYAALISYLTIFNLHSMLRLTSNLREFSLKSKLLHLPAACLRNLEIFQNGTDHSERGSLYWFLNHTVTRPGARLLRTWISQPLRDVGAIQARQDAVQELCIGVWPGILKLRETLSRCPDLEKGLCSIFYNKCSPLEFVLVTRALERIHCKFNQLQATGLSSLKSLLLQQIFTEVPDYLHDIKQFSTAISEKAARENDKANLFTDDSRYLQVAEVKQDISGVQQDLKDYRRDIRLMLRQPALDYITVSQTEYLVEVKNTQLNTVPKEWTQISSTKVVSRFHPPFVIEKYRRLCQLREHLVATVSEAWEQFLREFSEGFLRYQKAVQLLATLDVLLSLAAVARQDGYCRPKMLENAVALEIEDGRHPVIDALKSEQEQYVPNNTHLSSEGQRVMIVTGPNMGGKSSYIRQVALIAIMAQIGSMVPAASAELGVLDAIFTRMGAEDEIFRGRSTFMVELQETSEILSAATERSLVIIDELGRGTSTHDGMAIAYATLQHFVTEAKSLTLFVTHYPVLAEFQHLYPNVVRNFHMAFLLYDEKEESDPANGQKDDDDSERSEECLTFLYQLTEGAAGKSYGLNVARLAHLPPEILQLASTRSHQLEDSIMNRRATRKEFTMVYQASKVTVNDAIAAISSIDAL